MDLPLLPKGLTILPDFISVDEERDLLSFVDTQEWSTPSGGVKGRRVQNYGYQYNYKSRSVSSSSKSAPPIPELFGDISSRLSSYYDKTPNQAIVNEYLSHQGITAHTDSEVFGPTVSTISLSDEAVMVFRNKQTGETIEVLLSPRSAVILNKDARYLWTHEIPSKVTYVVDGVKKTRGQNWRRISLTFRSTM